MRDFVGQTLHVYIKDAPLQYMSADEKNADIEKNRRSIFVYNDIAEVFGPEHAKLMSIKHKQNQCVVGLSNQLKGDAEMKEGSAGWFVKKWENLLDRDRRRWRNYVSGNRMLNRLGFLCGCEGELNM